MWYDVMWCDVMWYDMIWYDMIWYDMIWYALLCCCVPPSSLLSACSVSDCAVPFSRSAVMHPAMVAAVLHSSALRERWIRSRNRLSVLSKIFSEMIGRSRNSQDKFVVSNESLHPLKSKTMPHSFHFFLVTTILVRVSTCARIDGKDSWQKKKTFLKILFLVKNGAIQMLSVENQKGELLLSRK